MKRIAIAGSLAIALSLGACSNQSDEDEEPVETPEASGSEGASDDNVDGEIVSEGPTDDATPYSGDDSSDSASGRAATNAPAVNPARGNRGSGSAQPSSSRPSSSRPRASSPGSMTKGSSTKATKPPKGSKLQKADPQ